MSLVTGVKSKREMEKHKIDHPINTIPKTNMDGERRFGQKTKFIQNKKKQNDKH